MDLKSKYIHTVLPSFFASRNFNAFKEANSISNISKYFLKDFFYKEYAVSPMEDVKFVLNLTGEKGLYFLFCWEGNLTIAIHDEDIFMEDFQSAIIHDHHLKGVSLKLKKDIQYRFCLIGFNHHLDIENLSYIKFKSAFFDRMNSDNEIFIGNRYLKLIRYIDKLSEKVKQNTVSQLIIEGLIYQIIGLKIEHLMDLANQPKTEDFYLISAEYKRVQLLTEKIKQNPGFEYTIEYLCKESALSPLKLQKGFKKMFHCTAMDYVREMRLEKALFLIKTTDLSISEIVYTIGLSSRSNFSKIFKLKYKCSPRIFRKQSHAKGSLNQFSYDTSSK